MTGQPESARVAEASHMPKFAVVSVESAHVGSIATNEVTSRHLARNGQASKDGPICWPARGTVRRSKFLVGPCPGVSQSQKARPGRLS